MKDPKIEKSVLPPKEIEMHERLTGLSVFAFIACGCALVNAPVGPSALSSEPDDFQFEQRYHSGEVHDYELRLEYRDSFEQEFVQTTRSHHVVSKEAPLRETISLFSMWREEKGTRVDLSEQAKKFPGWTVSRSKDALKDGLVLPEKLDLKLTQPVTDILTFLTAVSHQLGADKVRQPGARFHHAEPVRGNWSHLGGYVVAEDCLQTSIQLKSLSENTATFVSSFDAPEGKCLQMHSPFMQADVVPKVPNNFQQVRKGDSGWEAMWGNEKFEISSVVRREDGLILKAEMENHLSVRLKFGCNDTFEKCQAEVPLTIHRKLQFTHL